MSGQWRRCCRQSTPEQISLDLGTLRKNQGLMQKIRFRGPRYRTLGESVKRWTAWGWTLKFEVHSKTPSPRNHVQDDVEERLTQRISWCHVVQTSTFLWQPAALKAPLHQERPGARETGAFVTTTNIQCSAAV